MGEVLACVDFSDASELVVERAAHVAQALGDRLHVLHVAADEPTIAGYDKDDIATYRRSDRAEQLLQEHQGLRELAERLQAGGLEVVPLLEMGGTIDKINETAERIDAELIAVGSHGHGALHHVVLGSVSHALVKHATRPVLIVPIRPTG